MPSFPSLPFHFLFYPFYLFTLSSLPTDYTDFTDLFSEVRRFGGQPLRGRGYEISPVSVRVAVGASGWGSCSGGKSILAPPHLRTTVPPRNAIQCTLPLGGMGWAFKSIPSNVAQSSSICAMNHSGPVSMSWFSESMKARKPMPSAERNDATANSFSILGYRC